MDNNLIARASIFINAGRDKVWDALVNPDAIKQYMFGTTVVSDWREGGLIIWKGEWQGKPYEDKGIILKIKPEKTLQYSHFSPLSGLADKPENFHTVTIELAKKGNQTGVSLAQDNNPTVQVRVHSEKNWKAMLAALKKFLEQKPGVRINREQNPMQKIIPFLWFNDNAEEAVNLYVSIFKNSRILNAARYDEASAKASGKQKGTVMTMTFLLYGQEFMAINGGPQFTFSQAISFMVNCKTQAEVDELWEKLSQGGERQQCGWLKDKFGLSWQIVPTALGEMMQDKDPKKSQRVMNALLQMTKIDIGKLKEAYGGK